MFIVSEKVLKRTLKLSLAGTRGGPVRLKILLILESQEMNTNELSVEIKMDYKTVQHHIRILEKSGFIVSRGEKYGRKHMISPTLQKNKSILKEIQENMGKSR